MYQKLLLLAGTGLLHSLFDKHKKERKKERTRADKRRWLKQFDASRHRRGGFGSFATWIDLSLYALRKEKEKAKKVYKKGKWLISSDSIRTSRAHTGAASERGGSCEGFDLSV